MRYRLVVLRWNVQERLYTTPHSSILAGSCDWAYLLINNAYSFASVGWFGWATFLSTGSIFFFILILSSVLSGLGKGVGVGTSIVRYDRRVLWYRRQSDLVQEAWRGICRDALIDIRSNTGRPAPRRRLMLTRYQSIWTENDDKIFWQTTTRQIYSRLFVF
jgi:hypothetical protein